MTFSDAQLQAYLDGTLEAALSARLEQALEQDSALEARLLGLETLAAPIRDAFGDMPEAGRLDAILARRAAPLPATPLPATPLPAAPMPDAPPPAAPMPGMPLPAMPRPTRTAVFAAGLAAACLALGFFIAGLARQGPEPSWQDQVAQYQALYGPETIAHLDSDPALLDAQLARASAALGRQIALSDLSDVDGLSLRRAQILNFEGTPLVQIVYATEAGTPVALCILALSDGRTRPVEYEVRAGLPTSHWADGTYGYMVLGRLDGAALGDVTEHFAGVF